VNANCPGESSINIYLLVQNRLVREVLVRMLRKRPGLTVVGAGQESAEVFQKLAGVPCAVLLLDSLEMLRELAQSADAAECPKKIKPLIFAMQEDPQCFLEAVRLGACGFLLNGASAAEIIEAVRAIAQGEAICSPGLCNSLFEYVSREDLRAPVKQGQRVHAASELTCRQRQLMALVAKGMTNKEIAARLQLSQFTVKNHIHRVMAHLQTDSRHKAVDVIRTGGLFVSA
jgi:two-component system response regulator DegU